jgi:hypothetical protein
MSGSIFFVNRFSLILFLGVVSAQAQIQYDAICDREIRAKPPLPQIGLAGSSIKDPTYGSPILRVTDANTLPQNRGSAFFTTAGSFVQAWSSGSGHFFIRGETGILVFDFDPAKFEAKLAGKIPLDGVAFSGRTNDVLYGMNGKKIMAYSLSTKQLTLILDLNTVVPDYPQYQYALSVSADDSKFAVSFSGIQDTYRYLLWYDRSTGRKHLLDLKTSQIDGKPASIQFRPGAGLHSQDLDRSGRFVLLCGPELPGSNACFWEVETGTFRPQFEKASGHAALGYGCQINQSGVDVAGTSDGRGFMLRSLDNPNGNLRQLISPPPSKPYGWSYGGHWSWGSARPDVLNPIVGTFYREPDKRAWGLWDDEIVGVRADGKESKVWRFAHHRTVFDGKNFWDCPRGNLSPDGRWFIFTSNWEKTLGKDSHGVARQDVFLVGLKVAE